MELEYYLAVVVVVVVVESAAVKEELLVLVVAVFEHLPIPFYNNHQREPMVVD